MQSHNQEAFLALLRAGLWETEIGLSQFGNIDFYEIYQLAKEQSVTGLVAAGIDHVKDVKVPQKMALSFVGYALQIEQHNMAMNNFIAMLIDKMRKADIYAILVKGQGIAQCYERPLWRSSGDVDLLLSNSNYDKALEWFQQNGTLCLEENKYRKRIEYTVDGWNVELHGTMRGEVSSRIDVVIDEAQTNIFYNGSVRSCFFDQTAIFLPAPNEDVIFIFTHILQHFFRGGIGLRQICDWCRLIWTFHDSLNVKYLESQIRKMDVMTEWRTFAALAVNKLGLPQEAIPLYSPSKKWIRKAERVLNIIFETGNFGHNRDESYKLEVAFWKRMAISLTRRTADFIQQAKVFPCNACRAYWGVLKTGIGVVIHHIE